MEYDKKEYENLLKQVQSQLHLYKNNHSILVVNGVDLYSEYARNKIAEELKAANWEIQSGHVAYLREDNTWYYNCWVIIKPGTKFTAQQVTACLGPSYCNWKPTLAPTWKD